MKATRWVIIVLFVAMLGFGAIFPLQSVRADTGPKPSMDFRFVYEISPAPAIVSGTLLECDDPGCASSKPLGRMGPQSFDCSESDCSSMAYGYADYHKLRLEFSDGRTRESNVFGKKYFSAVYQVTVREDDLVVKEQRGGSMPLFFFLLASGPLCFVVPVIFILPVIFLIIVAVRAAGFNQARGIYIAAWIVSLLPLALNLLDPGLFTGLIFTLVVEMAIALAYGLWRKRPLVLLLTVVGMMNLLTRATLSLISGFFGYLPGGWASLLIAEAVIWLVEAGLLAWALRKQVRFLEALALSAALNLASFGLGLLLPI